MNISRLNIVDEVPQLGTETEPIVDQTPGSPRVFDAIAEYALSIQALTHSLFGRESVDFSGLIAYILFICDLQSILALRGVSKGFSYLVSIVGTNYALSPLASKAIGCFQCSQICGEIDKTTQEKYNFVMAQKMETVITTTINELINNPYIFNYFEENKIKLILKIETDDEITQLEEILLEPSNVNFSHKIHGLVFTMSINSNTSILINRLFAITVSSSMPLLPNLKNLSIDAIYNDGNLILPNGLDTLEDLSISGIGRNGVLTLPETFLSLKNLNIGYICAGAVISLPDFLYNLTIVTIGNLYTTLEFPELPNLKKLSIQGLFFDNEPSNMDEENNEIDYGFLDLPESLPLLEILSIGKIDDYLSCDLSAVMLDNLKDLNIGSIGWSVEITLPNALNKLTNFSMQNIHSDTVLCLPASLDNLINFSVKWLQEGSEIKLPKELNHLESLDLCEIERNVTLHFPDSIPNLKRICIWGIGSSGIIEVLKSIGCSITPVTPSHIPPHLSQVF